MSRVARWEQLTSVVANRGLDLGSEEGRTLAAWVWEDLDHAPPPSWQQDLLRALEHVLVLYRGFMDEFNACYGSASAPGERWVQRALRSRFGFALPQVVEAVLERIRDRRFHLLRAFRQRHQSDAFAPPTFDPQQLRGYFRRVAWMESRHVPLDRVLFVSETDPRILDDCSLSLPEEAETEAAFGQSARMLADFWTKTGGFSRAMQLEGLVSLGLGSLTGEPLLEQRCRDYLAERLPVWEKRRDEQMAQLRQLLAQLGRTEARLCFLRDGDERDEQQRETERLQARLNRLRERMQQHQDRLLPRPCHVRAMLSGLVDQQLGTVRFKRIECEIRLFEERTRAGQRLLRDGGAPDDLAAFATQVEQHLGARPASAREHGLALAERRRRVVLGGRWLDEGLVVLQRARSLLAAHFPPLDEQGQGWAVWLSDVQDLYELGVLDRIGVVGGLRRPKWRLEQMLRIRR